MVNVRFAETEPTIPVQHNGGPLNGTHNRPLLPNGEPTTATVYHYIESHETGPLVSKWGHYTKRHDIDGTWQFDWHQGHGEPPRS